MGTGYWQHTGSNGSYVSTPDTDTVSITGDLDLRAKLRLVDWTPASEIVVIGKFVSASRDYLLNVGTAGTLIFLRGNGGAGSQIATSSAATGVSDGAVKWIRATHRVSDHRVQFFLSDDGSSWSQLGTDITLTSVTPGNGSQKVEIGSHTNGSAGVTANIGHYYYAAIYNGIDGTLAAEADLSIQTAGASSFTGGGGETWTVNGATTGRSAIVGDTASSTIIVIDD